MDIVNIEKNGLVVGSQNSEKILDIFSSALKDNTKKSYVNDMRYVIAYLDIKGLNTSLPYPTSHVLSFIQESLNGYDDIVETALRSGRFKAKKGVLSASTIKRRVAAISVFHRMNGVPNEENPCLSSSVRDLMRVLVKAERNRGRQSKKRSALTADILSEFIDILNSEIKTYKRDLDKVKQGLIEKLNYNFYSANSSIFENAQNAFIERSIRDRALLLVGFATGGRRRSEITSLRIQDVEKKDFGYKIFLRDHKTDKSGEGMTLIVKGTPSDYLTEWLQVLDKRGIRDGYLFRGITPTGVMNSNKLDDKAVTYIIKRLCRLNGLDENLYSAHSLRSGFITTGSKANINLFNLMQLSGHSSVQTAYKYYREGEKENNPSTTLFDDVGKNA